MVHAAVNPLQCQTCGWAWERRVSLGNYKARGCASAGFHPPFPFPMGQMQLLSSSALVRLVNGSNASRWQSRRVATSRSHFAEHRRRCGGTLALEDARFGFWLASAQRDEHFRVTYVDVGFTGVAHTFGCWNHPGGRLQ
eukprot:5585311-Prymnesium_polylepis.1